MPKYNFPIKILQTSNKVCANSTKHDLVIVVKSGVYNFNERSEFRDFMSNQSRLNPDIKVGCVFSVGLPRSHGGRLFDRNGFQVKLKGPSGDVLEMYDGRQDEVIERLLVEIKTYDDIILADYEDTYYNLSWKTVTNLRWLSIFCDKSHGNFFMLIDDDHRMDLEQIKQFRNNTPVSKLRRSLFGFIGRGDFVNRSREVKWFMTYNEMPWDIAPPYPRGMSQFIGADIVDDMAIATAYTKHNYLNEDVYLGMLAYKLRIPLRNLHNMVDHEDYIKWNEKFPPMVYLKKYFRLK